MSVSLPENMEFVKPFSAFVLIKGGEEKDGKKVLYGPIAPEEPDYDKDVITKAGLDTGLATFLAFGGGDSGHVDWCHMFRKSKDPQYLIAKGRPYQGPDGRPWLMDELFESKPLAKAAWDHVMGGGHAGHSLEGVCKARDPKNAAHIVSTEIYLITIDPMPKGASNFLQVGVPQSMQAIAKGLLADIDRGELADSGWLPMPSHISPGDRAHFLEDLDVAERLMKSAVFMRRFFSVGDAGLSKSRSAAASRPTAKSAHLRDARSSDRSRCCDSCAFYRSDRCSRLRIDVGPNEICDLYKAAPDACPHCGAVQEMGNDGRCNRCNKRPTGPVRKALTTGGGVVMPGTTGGAALRKQYISEPQVVCRHCATKNRKSRSRCRRCGKEIH